MATSSAKKSVAQAGSGKSSAKSAAKHADKKAVKKGAESAPAPKKATQGAKAAAKKYTDPELRERIKGLVMAGDKGGNPGQWSARKAQMVAREYEAEGGGYASAPDETQKHLMDWGEEHWTTADGKPAKREDGMHRYLPEKAWKDLSPEEKRSTDKKKVSGSKTGKQFVANTGAAKKARKSAQQHTP